MRATMAAAADGDTPTLSFGAKALADQDTYPRIVWVPRGGRHDKKAFTSRDRSDNPSTLWTRHLAVDAHVFGEDETNAEIISNHMVAVLDGLLGGAYSMIGEDWNASESTADGVKVIVSFEVRMPWTREILAKVKPTSVAIAGATFIDSLPAPSPVEGNVA